MRWIFGYTKKYKWFVVIQILFGVLSASLSLVSAIISKYAIDIVINRKIGSLWLLIAAVAASAVAGLVFSSLQSRVSAKIALRVNNDMRAELFDKLMRADWQGVKKFQSGDILNRLNGGHANGGFNCNKLDSLRHCNGLFLFASSFVTILFYNVPMAFIALLSAPFLVVVSRGLMKKSRLFHRLVLEKESALMSFETETFCNYDTVKSLGAAEAYGERFRCKQEECKTASLDNNLFPYPRKHPAHRFVIYRFVCNLRILSEPYLARRNIIWNDDILPSAESAYHGGFFFIHKACSAAFEQCRFRAPRPRAFGSSAGAAGRNSRTGCGTCLPPAQPSPDEHRFSLPDDAAVKPVADAQLFFSAEPGEIIAVIGASGQGKTTLLRLILGLIRPEGGLAELVDDSGRAHTVSAEHRRLFSYVPQGNTVFSGNDCGKSSHCPPGSIRRGIDGCTGCRWVRPLCNKNGGIDARIGEKGHGISDDRRSGLPLQEQFCAMHRYCCLMRQPADWILRRSSWIIRNIIAKRKQLQPQLRSKKTCIVATHRLSILALCDKIFRVQDAK